MDTEPILRDQNEETDEVNPPTTSFISRILKKVTIEPALLLFLLAFGIVINVDPTLLLDRSCRVDYGFSQDICDDLKNNLKEEDLCQMWSNEIFSYTTILDSIPAAIVTLFAGAWSDKKGRKPLLLLAMFFYLLQSLYKTVFAVVDSIPASWYIASGLGGIGGGTGAILLSSFSYVTDLSTVEERNSRIAAIDSCLFVGLPLGIFISAFIFGKIGYFGIYVLSSALMLLAFFYIVFMMKDSRGISNDESSNIEVSYLTLAKETFAALLKKRPERKVSFLFILALLLYSFSIRCNPYYYTQIMYKWSEETFSYVSGLTIIFYWICSYGMLPYANSYLKFSDPTIAIFAELSNFIKNEVLTFSSAEWIFFLGCAVGSFSAYFSVVARSGLSKITPKEDIGKIFAALGFLESLVPSIATAFLNWIYNSALETFPGYLFMVVAAIHGVVILIMLKIHHALSSANTSSLVEQS